MPLPEKTLTANQGVVMDPLVANFAMAKQRLETAQGMYNKAVLALEEYAKQSAEKLSIDIVKDYSFDINSQKFLDRSTLPVEVAQEASPVRP
jgi:BarA-like signal transduction histidine kinase